MLFRSRSINCSAFVKWILTYWVLVDLFRCNPEDRKHLNHYLDNHIYHFRGWFHFCVDLDTSKKHFDSLEDVDKSLVTCSNIFGCLMDPRVTTAHAKVLRVHTERSTPTPAKIMVVGENAYQKYEWKSPICAFHTRSTGPTVWEKVRSTFIVGSSHFDHRSSVLRD